MNNEAERPGKVESLHMKESSQAHSLSKHVEKLERILDTIAPPLNTRRHHRPKATAPRHHDPVLPLHQAKNA